MSDNPNTGGEQTPPAGSTTQSEAGGNAQQPSAQSHQNSPVIDFAPLMTALNALPETIARSVKEAVGTPKTPESKASGSSEQSKGAESGGGEEKKESSKGGSDSGSSSTPPAQTPGKRRSFAEYWFGS